MNAEVLIKFKGDTSDADSKTKKLNTSIGTLTKSFTLASVAAKALEKGMQIFNSGLDGAINRVDTLNNFPKVMSNLGISANDSAEVISDLNEKLKGLPTTMDSAAAAVQRFTSKNGDVKESEKIFLAVNNAILAGGANTQTQASALEQLSQAYAKGKPDMMEWRSIMSAMPAQLKQVATTMGFIDADALGESLRNGSVSMDEFMNTMIKMNEEGVNGFKSFDEQARNATGGIGTSVTNMKTAIIRGIGNMLKSLDKSFEQFGGLSGILAKIGEFGESVFSGIGNAIATILPPLIEIVQSIMPSLQALFQQIEPFIQNLVSMVLPMIVSIISQIMPFLVQIAEAILPIIMQLLNTILPPLMQIISKILPVLMSLVESLLPLLQPILDLLTPLIEALFEIINPLVDILSTILPPIVELLSTILQTILPPLTAVVKILMDVIVNSIKWMIGIVRPIIDNLKDRIQSITGVLKGIIDFVKNIFTGNWKGAWEAVKNIFKNIVEGIGNIFKMPINFIIGALNTFIRGLNKIKIPDWVPAVGGKGLNIPEIPKLNIGTNYVPEDTIAMVHEGEAVIPKKFNPYANGINANTLGAMMSSNNSPIINVYADFEIDPIGQVVSNIKTFSGGAKNDYNYGQGV